MLSKAASLKTERGDGLLSQQIPVWKLPEERCQSLNLSCLDFNPPADLGSKQPVTLKTEASLVILTKQQEGKMMAVTSVSGRGSWFQTG